MWLKSLRRVPRGPFTMTVRPFRDTLTAKRAQTNARYGCEAGSTTGLSGEHYAPCSGMSTVWLLRMVFILQTTTTTSCRPGGKAPSSYTALLVLTPTYPAARSYGIFQPSTATATATRAHTQARPRAPGRWRPPRPSQQRDPAGPRAGRGGKGHVGESTIPAAPPLGPRPEHRDGATSAPVSCSQPGGAARSRSAADGVGCSHQPRLTWRRAAPKGAACDVIALL